ncbi:MAG: RidA family protein [Acidobacteria bacterium]|nr:RidA family protein [Acidobacteriota bacterium]
MTYEIFNPEQLGPAKGWNNAMLAPAGGRVLFIAGQTARAADGQVPDVGFVEQFALALDNVMAALEAAGGKPEHVGRMTVFVTDVGAYRESLKELGDVWRPRMGRNYPAMALLGVTELVDHNAMVEIETTAVIPPTMHADDAPVMA